MIKKIIFGIAILFTANACQQVKVETNADAYFSLKGFIDEQLKHMQGSQVSYRKVVKVNDQFEIKKIDNSNLAEDLKGFLSYDINKKAWKNSFAKDSDETNQTVYYTAIEEYIPVKKCAIIYEGNAIKKIRLFVRVENNLFTSVKIIDLFPSNTYSYYHSQQVTGLKKQVLFIKTIR
jgi:hypothetical protein